MVCNFAHSKFEQFEEQLIEGKISFIVIIIDSDSEQLTCIAYMYNKEDGTSFHTGESDLMQL